MVTGHQRDSSAFLPHPNPNSQNFRLPRDSNRALRSKGFRRIPFPPLPELQQFQASEEFRSFSPEYAPLVAIHQRGSSAFLAHSSPSLVLPSSAAFPPTLARASFSLEHPLSGAGPQRDSAAFLAHPSVSSKNSRLPRNSDRPHECRSATPQHTGAPARKKNFVKFLLNVPAFAPQ